MCGRYVVTNAVTKTKNIVKTAINVQDSDNYNAHPYQNLPVVKKYKRMLIGNRTIVNFARIPNPVVIPIT